MNPNIDHTGPMTRTVADNALMLEVLAGPDGEDSRQCSVSVHPYTESISRDIAGLRIGILREGFGTPLSELGVDQCVRAAAERFENLGASVSEISVPLHAQAGIITMDGLICIRTICVRRAKSIGISISITAMYGKRLVWWHQRYAKT